MSPQLHQVRESVLQRRIGLAEMLDLSSFGDVVKSFVDLYRVGIKVFDDRGKKMADFKIGNGDFCGYVFSFPEGRRRCMAHVSRVKGGPPTSQTGEHPLPEEFGGGAGIFASPCFTGLRYLIMPVRWEGDELGRVIFGPFAPEELKGHPESLTAIARELDLSQLDRHLQQIRRAPEQAIARVMGSFAQILGSLIASGQKMYLTSQLHIETTLESNRELERQNQRLAEMNARLRELDRLKSSFLATVSHELRTPLTSIIGYSEMLSEGLAGPLNGEQGDYVRTIMEKGETLLRLISSILDLSQIEAGRLRLRFESLDVPKLLQGGLSSVAPQAQKKGVRLELAPDEGAVTRASGDREKLSQVFVNLLANAVKFTPGGGTVRVRVTPAAHLEALGADGYGVVIEDSGPGIAQDQLGRIFESFYQVDSSSTREFGGAGLGLSIVQSFVQGHGGIVTVQSEVGQGSRFLVQLPLAPERKEQAMSVATPRLPTEPDAPDRF